jgi:3-deoxy-D-manno-octulosonic-acid transferase
MPEQSKRASGIGTMFTRDAYSALTLIGAASDDDARYLVRAGARAGRIRVTGDTRYDQAWNRAHVARRNQPVVDSLRSDRPTVVAGSTWSADEQVLMPAFEHLRQSLPNARLIIAPHEIREPRIASFEDSVRRAGMRVTRLYAPDAPSADVVIVDRVGILADLYAVATVAYVGGGFHDAGLHSLVEPAVLRVPSIIGPRHAASRDARMMLAGGGAVVASDETSMFNALQRIMTDDRYRASMSEAMGDVVASELGAGERSFEVVRDLLGSV